MEIKVPSVPAIKFNSNVLSNGTPIMWKQVETYDHFVLALVREYGPNILQVYNGHTFHTFNVMDVHSGSIEIIVLRGLDETDRHGNKLIIETTVFDVVKIPAGSIFIDADGMSFIIEEVDPYYLQIVDHNGNHQDIQAETFFVLDAEETEGCRIIIPPNIAAIIKAQAVSYKDKV